MPPHPPSLLHSDLFLAPRMTDENKSGLLEEIGGVWYRSHILLSTGISLTKGGPIAQSD